MAVRLLTWLEQVKCTLHCWKCGAVLGPAHSLEELIASKRPAIVDVTRLSAVRRLYQKANEIGYEHDENEFFQFFEELNRRRR